MNRKSLADFISNDMNITKTDAKLAVDSLVYGIAQGLDRDGKVALIGLGTFYAIKRKARTIKNPKTGEMVEVPERTVIKFKSSKVLKEFINEEKE